MAPVTLLFQYNDPLIVFFTVLSGREGEESHPSEAVQLHPVPVKWNVIYSFIHFYVLLQKYNCSA